MDLERKLARKIQRTIENCYQHFNVFIKLEIFLYDKKTENFVYLLLPKAGTKKIAIFRHAEDVQIAMNERRLKTLY